jgi:hypothetical protein
MFRENRDKHSLNDKRRLAIYNNNALYEAVFADHRIEFRRTDLICYAVDETPSLYSNLVTVSEDWRPDEIFESIDSRFEFENWAEWSIKDSFGILDLDRYNFTKLFEAQWFYLDAGSFAPAEKIARLRFDVVDRENDLADWRIAWDRDERLGREIFNARLLNDEKIHFVAGRKGGEIVCGCLVNKSGDVLGISNFFAPDKNIDYWSQTIEFIFSSIERRNIVGYERNDLAAKLATALKFETAGNLVVWLKKRDY